MNPSSTSAHWCVVTYYGDKAKSVKAHAEAGIGYIVLNEAGSGQKYAIQAAVRIPAKLPVPPNGRKATPDESQRFERRMRAMQGQKT